MSGSTGDRAAKALAVAVSLRSERDQMQFAATLPALARLATGAVVDGVLPPRCLACGEPDSLCGRCWSSITFFAPPWCANCGLTAHHGGAVAFIG